MFFRRMLSSAIKVGDKIPEATLSYSSNQTEQGVCAITKRISTSQLFAGKRTVLFAVPGAFTPGCHMQHLPSFLKRYDDLKAKNVDQIVCLATNDAYVMDAWAKDQKVGDKIMMVADGNADFVKALGLSLDLTKHGMGVRSERFLAVIEDGVLKNLVVGDIPVTDASSALAVL